MARDLVAKVGEYTDKNGEKKSKWLNVGVILPGKEGGEFVLLDPTVNLAGVLVKQRMMNPQKGGDTVMVSVFDRDSQGGQSGRDDFSDDIPF